ncbi:MAG: hypothetical protein U9N84_08045, partial [Actinomycetota bacterium]|nr:hypothetical protein [Actinomycetota bacterium]
SPAIRASRFQSLSQVKAALSNTTFHFHGGHPKQQHRSIVVVHRRKPTTHLGSLADAIAMSNIA